MALHCLADSTDLRLFVPPHRTYSLTLQLPILSGPPFESSPATLLDDVQGLLGQKTLARSRFTSQTACRHLQDFNLEVSPEFLRILGIVRFTKTFRKFLFVLLGNAFVPETADIQPSLVRCRYFTSLEPYFQGSHEKSVVGPGELGAPNDPAVLDKSPATAYVYMVDLSAPTTAIGISSPAVQVGL